MSNFEKAMEFVGLWEWGNRKDGGYTNDPDDPGGETKFGISKRAHPDEDIAQLTKERAFELYKAEYWDSFNCDRLDFRDSMARFDSAINCGVGRVAIWLDGAKDYKELLEYRRRHYETLVKKKPLMSKYFKGWMNRLKALHEFIEKHSG